MGTLTIGGNARGRNINPTLRAIIERAAARSPYDVQIFSGERGGKPGGSRHNTNNAIDIALVDPNTGQAIPNYKSSVGFPMYAEFAKVAREEQMSVAPEMASQFRWGGGFSDQGFDLMHFDFKPGGAMRYWTWEDGGKLTAAGAEAIPKYGPGKIYHNGERYNAPSGQYANLWETAPAPQDAQSAIASLIAPSGGTGVPDQPTAAMGYAPNIPADASFTPPMPQVQTAAAPPMPAAPPQWAQNAGFPIDESLTGASAQDVLTGGPRMDPRRIAPGTGPIPPDMGAMRSPADVLAAGPRLRPGGAPDASQVPDPLSRLASGVTPPPPQSVAMRNPPMRPGGAPDASMVPTPPSRASGLPNPPIRPDINDPSLSFNAPPYAGGGPTGGPPMPAGLESMVAGRPEFPGSMPGDSRGGGLSAAMGNAPPRPSLSPPRPEITDRFKQSLDLANDMNRTREDTQFWTGDLQSQASPPWGPTVAGRPEFPGGGMPAAQGPFFDAAAPSLSLPPSWSPTSAFPAPPAPVGTVEAGSTGGEFFSPAPPMPSAPPAMSQGMRDQFDVAFSPSGGGQIMDLQSAFNRQNAPPTMNAQGGIDSIFGAPPAIAQPSNLAIPFAEVPGFDPGRFAAATPASPSSLFGPAPASAATVASPLPSPIMPPSITQADFDARFGGGSVIAPTPQAGITPGVVSGEMPQPMDIRSQAQGGPPMPSPAATSISAPPPAPRQTSTPGGQKSGIFGRILGGLLGGPLGALGGGLLGGGGGGGFGFGGQPSFAWSGGGSAPYGNNGGSTTYQTGRSTVLGGSNVIGYTDSQGRPLTVTQDPWTQTYYGPVAG